MRIAWLGPEPNQLGGTPYAATQIITALARAGVELHVYLATDSPARHVPVDGIPGVTVIREGYSWAWGRWYSRGSLMALSSSQALRFRAQRDLIRRMRAAHARCPYDLVYQFSQIESPWSRGTARQLPPVVVHPEVHAAGELRWHRREAALSRQCEPFLVRAATRGVLLVRSVAQKRSLATVDALVAPSTVFGEEVIRDYQLPRERLHVVPNPIDLVLFRPGEPLPAAPEGTAKLQILFVSRMALRKGVELVVALSHRIADLADDVNIRLVGGGSLLSNYLPLLKDLHPMTASYEGPVAPLDLAKVYQSADMLIQPSHYEPFALTVGEALASGLPVVVSDRVGAAEGVAGDVCRVFPAGNLDAFERDVRATVATLRAGRGSILRSRARHEAERLFDPDHVAAQLLQVFEGVIASRQGLLSVS